MQQTEEKHTKSYVGMRDFHSSRLSDGRYLKKLQNNNILLFYYYYGVSTSNAHRMLCGPVPLFAMPWLVVSPPGGGSRDAPILEKRREQRFCTSTRGGGGGEESGR